MNYNELNTHPRDPMVSFNPADHSYLVSTPECPEPTPCISVTTLVDSLFEKFDAPAWARIKAPGLGCTPDELLRKWEENARQASELGTALHENIERHYLGLPPLPGADRAFELFRIFASSRTLAPYRSEWRIFSRRFRVAGTLDFLACSDGRFELWDWKRSTKVIRDGQAITRAYADKRGIAPAVAHIPDTSYWHYALQLSLYRLILETEYGITPEAAYLGVFHPDNPCPYICELPYLRSEAADILNSRL